MLVAVDMDIRGSMESVSVPSSVSTSPHELQQHLDSLEHDLRQLINRSYRKSYSAVKVLFLNWKDCNLDLWSETRQSNYRRYFARSITLIPAALATYIKFHQSYQKRTWLTISAMLVLNSVNLTQPKIS